MKKYSRNCSASNCGARKIVGSTIPSFFRFPLDEERCKVWCIRSGRTDLLDKPVQDLHQRNYLCSKHFSKNLFLNSSGKKIKRLRLISTAIPSKDDFSEETTSQDIQEMQLNLDLNKSSNMTSDVHSQKMIGTRSLTPFSLQKSVGKYPDRPYLEVRMLHNGCDYDPYSVSDVTYKYKGVDGSSYDIDVKVAQNDCVMEENDEDFQYVSGNNVFIVKKSVIKEFRRENNYYGPLRVIPEMSVISEDGIIKEMYSTRLEAVDFSSVSRTEDRSVIDTLQMYNTPGIIPACKPPFQATQNQDDDFTHFCRLDKKYKVSNKALAVFKELSGVDTNLDLKLVDEIFQTSDDQIGVIPVTLLVVAEKKNDKSSKFILLKQKKRKMKLLRKKSRLLKRRKKRNEQNDQHYYGVDYTNWSRRGSACFNEIRRVGIRFIDQLLSENLIDDDLKDFATKLSSTAELETTDSAPYTSGNVVESAFPAGSKACADETWYFLSNLVKNDRNLIEFQYGMENEKWIEVKRTFNLFQINGESVSDITLKVVCRNVDSIHSLIYYLRCLGRLVKTGTLSLKSDVICLLKSFQKGKYVCTGFDKDKFIYQTDENEMLRKHLKENCYLSATSFESLHSRNCSGIVRDSPGVENYKFERGDRTVEGPLIVCRPCQTLAEELYQMVDHSLICSSTKDAFSNHKPRFGPVQGVRVERNIAKLCTETPFEFVADARKEEEQRRRACTENGGNKSGFTSKTASPSFGVNLSEDERQSVQVSEKEFEGMVVIKKSPESGHKLEKSCVCGFQAKSMLSLFTHMSGHVDPNSCKTAVYSAAELNICAVCDQTFVSLEDLSHHMSSHRSSKPFICIYCDQRYQTIEAYKKHMKVTHHMETIKQMQFMCDMCQAYFYTHDHLMIHCFNENHTKNVSIKCRICHVSCDSVLSLQTHILNHTYDQREVHNTAICLECKRIFFSSYELEDHTKKEHGDLLTKQKEQIESEIEPDKNDIHKTKEFQCGRCFKIYETLDVLEKHFQVSHTERTAEEPTEAPDGLAYSLVCNLCGLKFTSDYFLNLHMNFHATNRPSFDGGGSDGDLNYAYTTKRPQPMDHVVRSENPKPVDKHHQIIQQQQQVTYSHMFNAEHAVPFVEGAQLGTAIAGQSQVIQVASSDTTWTQQPNPATLDEAQDSVYSFLHL